jgi:hypothetical protein
LQNVSVSEFRPQQKNTLRGFFTLHFGALAVRDCALHEKDGKTWFSFPGRKWEKSDGTTSWVDVCFIEDRDFKERLQAHICALLAKETVS